MKIKNINSVKVQFTTLMALKNETLTLIPKIKIDDDNGEEYVEKVYCLEQDKDYPVAPFLTVNLLPGWLQFTFPAARITINPTKD